ncbi:ATP phosphoribosyltransferase [Gammaproteobacteria bacterium]|nr:ATP phosphoribosyltransferase [Gammaproteobacteria bacterium]
MFQQSHQKIIIALSKGRILNETLPLLAAANIEPIDDLKTTRKLILETTHPNIKLVILRATDVPTYVQYGAADLGVTGKDVVMEHGGEGLYEPLDLNIACCRLMTAGFAGTILPKKIRVATKYANITRRYFQELGIQAEIIKLYGAMELAPIVGLADIIVDVVDTGNTLRANGLVPLDLIAQISSRVIVNHASFKLKHEDIKSLLNILENQANTAFTQS